jgi:uncharacterized protein YbaR (Trm112 family)
VIREHVVLPDALVEILVCPTSKQPLIYFPRGEDGTDEARGFLLCPASRRRYRIEAGVAVMLAEEATELAASATSDLVERAQQLGLRVPT